MTTNQGRLVNGRRHFSKTELPIKNCIRCLYRLGIGCKTIARLVAKDRGLVAKWRRKLDLPRAAETRKRRGWMPEGQRGGRTRRDGLTATHAAIMAEYRAAIRHQNKAEVFWGTHHPYVESWRRVKYDRLRRKSSPAYKAKFCLRKRMREFMKRNNFHKTSSISALIGCTGEQLRTHIEQQFQHGMTWANHGEWELDHIKPLSSFNLNDPAQLAAAAHYSNAQPLWKQDNREKGASLPLVYVITHKASSVGDTISPIGIPKSSGSSPYTAKIGDHGAPATMVTTKTVLCR